MKKEYEETKQSYMCPCCGSNMEVRNGQYGKFLGCKRFRKDGCPGTRGIPKVNGVSLSECAVDAALDYYLTKAK